MKTKVFLVYAASTLVLALIAGWSPYKDVRDAFSALTFLGLLLTVLVGLYIIDHE